MKSIALLLLSKPEILCELKASNYVTFMRQQILDYVTFE
jgi:hypothetical protein